MGRLKSVCSAILIGACVLFIGPFCGTSNQSVEKEKEITLHLDSPQTQQYADQLKWWVNSNIAKGDYPGLAYGIVVDNKLVWSHYQNTNSTRKYSLASITKTFTGLAVMQLVDEGKIDLDDPASKYLPGIALLEVPELGNEPIRIKHLLSHTSGLPDMRYYPTPQWVEPKDSNIQYRLPKQIYPAGAHYRYSNHGFQLLGEIVIKVTGKSLRERYTEKIFLPSGMKDTIYGEPSTGAAGIQTTLPDLAAYASLWLNKGKSITGHRILSEKAFERMLQPPLTYPEGENIAYCGLSWRTERSEGTVHNFFHIGGADYIMSWVQMFPRHKAAVVYLGSPPHMTDEVMGRIQGLQYRMAIFGGLITGAPASLNDFSKSLPTERTVNRIVGSYVDSNTNRHFRVDTRSDGTPVIFHPNGFQEVLTPTSVREFAGTRALYDITFVRGQKEPKGIATVNGYYFREEETAASQ